MVLPALSVRVPNPANALLQAEQIKGVRSQNQALQQQQEGRNALLTAFQGNDFRTPAGRDAIVGQVAQTAPLQALQLQQQFGQLSAQDQARVARQGQQTARALIGVGNQAQYSQARAALGPLGQGLPEQFDPGFVQSTINQARTIDSLLKPPDTTALSPGQSLVNTQTGDTVANIPPAPTATFSAVLGPNGNIIGQRNSQTGQVVPDPRAGAAVDPQDQFKNANALRDEFVSQTDDFAQAQTGFQRVLVGANQDSGQGDVALIFGFMKTIDPASTVREGEFATAEDTGSAGQRFIGLYNRVVEGERLTPIQRQGFVDAARAQFESQRQGYDQTVSEYTRLANQFGLEPANVIVDRALQESTDVSTADIQPAIENMARPTTQEGYDALPDGAWYIDPNGIVGRKGTR